MEAINFIEIISLLLNEGASFTNILISFLIYQLLKAISQQEKNIQDAEENLVASLDEINQILKGLLNSSIYTKNCFEELEKIKDEIRRINRKVDRINDTMADDDDDDYN